jgi:hypothetical protein
VPLTHRRTSKGVLYIGVHPIHRRAPHIWPCLSYMGVQLIYIGTHLIHGHASHTWACISYMGVHLCISYMRASHIRLCIYLTHELVTYRHVPYIYRRTQVWACILGIGVHLKYGRASQVERRQREAGPSAYPCRRANTSSSLLKSSPS